MKLRWTELVAVLVGAGCAVGCAGVTRALRGTRAKRELNAAAKTARALRLPMAKPGRPQATRVQERKFVTIAADAGRSQEAPGPEILAALTAAATAFVGKTVRIRSAHLLPAEPEGAGNWAQQGRVLVQKSHHVR